ncbi:MAG: hypothetical protein AAGI34_08360 [Pseudomonadota bacterium]
MNMLIEELQFVSGNPLSWAAVAVLLGFVLASVWRMRTCPLVRGKSSMSPAEAAELVDRPLVDGPRFFLTMGAGVALTITGLTLISEGIYPLMAFYALVAGVFVIQTEPTRREIRHFEMRVVAAHTQGEEAVTAAMARLCSAHLWLVILNGAMALATATLLYAF